MGARCCGVPETRGSVRGLPTGLPADCRGRWESFVEETLSEANRRRKLNILLIGMLETEQGRQKGGNKKGDFLE